MNYFYYDAMMRRYAMQDSNGLSYFTWDQNGMNLLAERDSAGAVIAYYTHGYTPVDGIGSMVAAKGNLYSTSYYHYPVYDHRGTVVRLVDQNGTPTAYYEYDAWGNQLRNNVVGGVSENRFRYQSNWIDLVDSDGRACLSPTRIYCQAVGRFLGRDLRDHLAGTYAYCGTFTVRCVDPHGTAETLTDKQKEEWLEFIKEAKRRMLVAKAQVAKSGVGWMVTSAHEKSDVGRLGVDVRAKFYVDEKRCKSVYAMQFAQGRRTCKASGEVEFSSEIRFDLEAETWLKASKGTQPDWVPDPYPRSAGDRTDCGPQYTKSSPDGTYPLGKDPDVESDTFGKGVKGFYFVDRPGYHANDPRTGKPRTHWGALKRHLSMYDYHYEFITILCCKDSSSWRLPVRRKQGQQGMLLALRWGYKMGAKGGRLTAKFTRMPIEVSGANWAGLPTNPCSGRNPSTRFDLAKPYRPEGPLPGPWLPYRE